LDISDRLYQVTGGSNRFTNKPSSATPKEGRLVVSFVLQGRFFMREKTQGNNQAESSLLESINGFYFFENTFINTAIPIPTIANRRIPIQHTMTNSVGPKLIIITLYNKDGHNVPLMPKGVIIKHL
jgi:hypothetical protein